MPYQFNATCQCLLWKNWTSYLSPITNSTSPVATAQTVITNALPWYWPTIPFLLYLMLMSWYSDSPQRGKLYMIAALVFVISAFLAIGGYIPDAIFNFFVFVVAFFFSKLVKGT